MMLEWDRTNGKSKFALDNKLGIATEEELAEPERRISKARLVGLIEKEKDRNIVFNKEYFLSIHKYIFQDIYPWAGTIREVDLYKGDSAFAPARFLDGSLNDLFDNLKKDNYLQGFTTEEVAELSSYYMLELNFIHPFREGNGRTKRHFMTQLVDRAGYDLGLESIEPNQLVMADILAFDDNEADIKANPSYLKFLIKSSVKPISAPNKGKTDSIEELNRFLWVYDRYDSRGWFTNKSSLQDAQIKLKDLLSTEQGGEKVKTHLDKIILSERKFDDGSAEYRRDIVKMAKEYKNQIDSGMFIKQKETVMEQQKGLAERLDEFYAKVSPYDRYDATGSFDPEYDEDKVGLYEIKENLKTAEGIKGIDNWLKEIISDDRRPEIVKEAKQFRLELLDPRNNKGSIKTYMEEKKPIKRVEQKETKKKQKSIK